MKRLMIACVLLTIVACSDQPEGKPVVRASLGDEPVETVAAPSLDVVTTEVKSACSSMSFEGVILTHCIADPEKHTISTALAPASGQNFGTIKGWAAGRDASNIAFVMNAGMYGDDLKPIGYFVQESERLVEVNRQDGPGNFHMKPNGIFFGSDGRWRVLDTDTFYRTIGDRPKFGTQSGPMLVINGELHPDFQDNGPSRAIRNGVGVDEAGKAHFVISEEPISFGQFARFFRDELKTPNAMFLDGNVSSLWDPAKERMDNGRVGPLLVVTRK